MDYDTFVELIVRLPEELIMDNPSGRGMSTIIWCDGKRVCYKRGDLRMYVDFHHLYEIYRRYSGRTVTTNDLRTMNPSVFDSKQNGHSCHCTFLFMALRQMGVVSEIYGSGRTGNPFGVSLPSL